MSKISTLKRVLCLLILACLFLPLCQCSQKASPDTATQVQEATGDEDLIMIRAIAHDEPTGTAGLLPFIWPIGGLLLAHWLKRDIARMLVNTLELLAATASLVYMIQVIRFWGTIRYGGIILLGGYLLYIVVSAAMLISLIRKWQVDRPHSLQSS